MGTEVPQGEAGCRKEFKIVLCAELAETGYSRSVRAPGGRCNSKQLQGRKCLCQIPVSSTGVRRCVGIASAPGAVCQNFCMEKRDS